jgi:hypothetical protein
LKGQSGKQRRQEQRRLKQLGKQPGQAAAKQEQALFPFPDLELFLQRHNEFFWTGLLAFECAASCVYSFGVAPAVLSFECLVDERVGLGLAAAIAPPFQGQLLALLEGTGAMGALETGGEGGTGMLEGADEGLQPAALASGSIAAAPDGAAAGGIEREANAEVAARDANSGKGWEVSGGAVKAGKGDTGAKACSRAGVGGKGASFKWSVQTAADPAETTPETRPAPSAYGIYSCLQAYANAAGFPALMAAYQNTKKHTGAPILPSPAIFTEQHAEFWWQVLQDVEQRGIIQGSLLPPLFEAVKVIKSYGVVLSAALCSVPTDQQMVDLGHSPQLSDMAAVGSLLSVCDPLLCSKLKSYMSASAPSFCCSNPSCINLEGTSELELLMGGAAGKGGGYCAGCNQVCYCSEACQRHCWEQHREGCTRIQRKTERQQGKQQSSA